MYEIKEDFLNKVTIYLPDGTKIFLTESTSQDDLEKCYNQSGNEKFIELKKSSSNKSYKSKN